MAKICAYLVCWRRSTKGEIGVGLDETFESGRKRCRDRNPEKRPGTSLATINRDNFSSETMNAFSLSGKGRITQLIAIFCLWKALLLLLAAFCPGPGYDTSAVILLDASSRRHHDFSSLIRHERLTLNLLRWDALYFVKAAERGLVHEQGWAFSGAYSYLLRLTGQFMAGSTQTPLHYYVLAGIVVSNVCHLLSVLVLYRLLTLVLVPQRRQIIPFIAAVLHILTPASLFMCAPYAEAMFSLLNFTGMLLYAQSQALAETGMSSIQEDIQKLGSGFCFAAAALVRSNGLLSGVILLYDVARYMPLVMSAQLSVHDLRRITVTCVAGSLIALTFLGPQVLAYAEFCNRESGSETRPWCDQSFPSIYSWVQSHYWNVGLFRYWTLSNLPLFLLAAPVSWLLLTSSVTILRSGVQRPLHGRPVPQTGGTAKPWNGTSAICKLPELAFPQLILALTAVTSFHVQIVNRIASGYPIWYLVVATWLVDSGSTARTEKGSQKARWYVQGGIIYCLVQGMLYANFLPPA
ncbi:phosphatidylinositol glycan, class V [Alternaria panax]|uniref:GPI mannosyltransferase 2 n=1 Tax=Alternaria panax TaxID=48097 RepID=A0AAD4FD76_9PLEO|nr:phosphatidylinositol glycan, class V [Alternaria panax]